VAVEASSFINRETIESDLFLKDAKDGLQCGRTGDRESRRLQK
jgi:hypothetical protein